MVGLTDDYTHDGRVLVEALEPAAVPPTLRAHQATLLRLGQVYKQINAPFGRLGLITPTISTHALISDTPNDAIYTLLENLIQSWTHQRDTVAGQMKTLLEGAEFNGQAIDVQRAKSLIAQGEQLLSQAANVASFLNVFLPGPS